MPINDTNEKRFESDIESALLSPAGGYVKGEDTYNPKLGLYVDTLIDFIQKTQPKEWVRFANTNKVNTIEKFCNSFNNACDMYGLLCVLRHGFKHRGISFRVCYFKPESTLNQTAAARYAANLLITPNANGCMTVTRASSASNSTSAFWAILPLTILRCG